MKGINYKFICTLQIWDQVLESDVRMNVVLQSKTHIIDKASAVIKGLTRQAKIVYKECGTEENFPEKRWKGVKRVKIQINEGIDKMISKFKLQFGTFSTLFWQYKI